jgi:NADH:ubiquinone oxidoreductase subunit D
MLVDHIGPLNLTLKRNLKVQGPSVLDWKFDSPFESLWPHHMKDGHPYQMTSLHPLLNGGCELDLFLDDDLEVIQGGKVAAHTWDRGIHQLLSEGRFLSFLGGNFHKIRSCLNSVTSPFWTALWNQSTYELASFKPTHEMKLKQMLILELSRIDHHLMTLGHLAKILGERPLCQFSIYLRQIIESHFYDIDHKSFNRLNENGPIQILLSLLNELKNHEEKFLNMILYRSHQSREKPIGAMSAMELGLSGPNLRACGFNFDLRQEDEVYKNQMEFQAILGAHGTSHDRFMVRLGEIKQSRQFIYQLLDLKEFWKDEKKGPEDFHFLLESQRGIPAAKNYYWFVEGPEGEMGLFMIFDGENPWPKYIKLRTPSAFNLITLAHLLEDLPLKDLNQVYPSLGITPGESDGQPIFSIR